MLGHNVLLRLDAEGHEVVAVVRSAGRVKLPHGRWQLIEGQPTEADTLRHAAAGCEAIVNCAGVTDMSLTRRDDYEAVNHHLCSTLVDIMQQTGIKCLVHTSTVNTIGYGNDSHDADESSPMAEPYASSHYAASKAVGEEVVVKAACQHPDWHTIVINPGFMLGAWDVKPSSGRMLQVAYRRPLMVAPKGGKAFVAVGDVATAIVNALTHGVNGQRYIVAGQCMSIRELYRMQARVMGYRQRMVTLPRWLMAPAGWLGDGLRSCGIHTELSTNNIKQLQVQEHYDGSRATRELDVEYTTIEQAIKDFHQWREKQKQ